MKTSPHVVKTKPHLVQKVWGGRRLEQRFGKTLLEQGSYGEAWEVADLDEGQSVVASGPLSGLPLRTLSEGWQRALVGRKAPRADRFPLLLKLLDANRDLSVQVHPGREDAARMEGAHSKEETWLILDVEEGAEIIHGLTESGIDSGRFRDAVDGGELEALLRRIEVDEGDVVDVSPGTIHAICSGVALLEIQEPSDTTYRVYDYDRPGLDGKPRPLHIDQALQVATLGRSEQVVRRPEPMGGPVELVSKTSAYRIERVQLGGPATLSWGVDPDSAQVLHLLEGQMVLEDGIGGQVELEAYESAVVPAFSGSVQARVETSCSLIAAGMAIEELMRGLRVVR